MNLFTLGKNKSDIKLAEILNEFNSNKFSRKVSKKISMAYYYINQLKKSIKDPEIYFTTICLYEEKFIKEANELNLPSPIKEHMLCSLTSIFRDALRGNDAPNR